MLYKVRTVRFQPYRRGMGPTFTLQMYDGETHDHYGKSAVCFRLISAGKVIFSAMTPSEAFYSHYAVDSDGAVEGIMGFLTLKPGDTDAEYFANYTEAQFEFCSKYAETLSMAVQDRLCDENGNLKSDR